MLTMLKPKLDAHVIQSSPRNTGGCLRGETVVEKGGILGMTGGHHRFGAMGRIP